VGMVFMVKSLTLNQRYDKYEMAETIEIIDMNDVTGTAWMRDASGDDTNEKT